MYPVCRALRGDVPDPSPAAPVLRTVSSTQRTHGQSAGTARECDVSAFLGVTTPSVTKLVNDMTSIGLLDKHADPSDRRAVTLTLTARELDLRRTYVEEYLSLIHI